MTTVSPYGRYEVIDRLSAWGLVGWGTGDMAITFDDGTAPVRTDLSMRIGALEARGVLLEQGGKNGKDGKYGKSGMDLALKADALYVRTDSARPRTPSPLKRKQTGCGCCWRAGGRTGLTKAGRSGPCWNSAFATTAGTRRRGRAWRSGRA